MHARAEARSVLGRELTAAFAGATRTSELLFAVMRAIARAAGAVRAETWLVAAEGDALALLADIGERRGPWAELHARSVGAELARGQDVAGAAWEAGCAMRVACVSPASASALAMVVPIGGRPCGVMVFYGEGELEPIELGALDEIGVRLGAELARIELERADRRRPLAWRELLDGLPDPVVAIDAHARVRGVNRAAARLFSASEEDLVGRDLASLAAARWRSRVARLLRAALHAQLPEGRARVVLACAAGERVFEAAPARLDEDGLALVAHDVTEEVRSRRALVRARVVAERAVRARDELTALVAHELRNPLAAIALASDLLSAGGSAEAARAVIDRQWKHADRLLEDLLDVTRAARGKLGLERTFVRASEIVRLAVEMAAPRMQAKGHRLEVRADGSVAWLHGDKARLVQVLTNLLANAARYTPPRGHVVLALRELERTVVFTVRDDGIGMTPELCASAFEPFRQGERPRDGGLGLGLAIVRSLVEQHGGSVSIASDGLGLGTQVEVRLPRASK